MVFLFISHLGFSIANIHFVDLIVTIDCSFILLFKFH